MLAATPVRSRRSSPTTRLRGGHLQTGPQPRFADQEIRARDSRRDRWAVRHRRRSVHRPRRRLQEGAADHQRRLAAEQRYRIRMGGVRGVNNLLLDGEFNGMGKWTGNGVAGGNFDVTMQTAANPRAPSTPPRASSTSASTRAHPARAGQLPGLRQREALGRDLLPSLRPHRDHGGPRAAASTSRTARSTSSPPSPASPPRAPRTTSRARSRWPTPASPTAPTSGSSTSPPTPPSTPAIPSWQGARRRQPASDREHQQAPDRQRHRRRSQQPVRRAPRPRPAGEHPGPGRPGHDHPHRHDDGRRRHAGDDRRCPGDVDFRFVQPTLHRLGLDDLPGLHRRRDHFYNPPHARPGQFFPHDRTSADAHPPLRFAGPRLPRGRRNTP